MQHAATEATWSLISEFANSIVLWRHPKMRQNHNDRCLMDVEEAPHLVGWREN
jgi:hypothetical protein